MKLIDMHMHTLECGKMCGARVDATYGVIEKEIMSKGIDKAVLMPINDILWQPTKKMNEYLASLVADNSSLVGFIDIDISTVHLNNGLEKLESEILYYYSKGLKGIKVHLQNLGVKADDWRLLPVYRLAGELCIPVTIHCYPGSSPGLQNNSDPVSIEKMVRVFHKTTFIIAHFGGVKYFYDMQHLNYNNVYFETSGVLPILKKYIGINNMRLVFEEIGYCKIMFGSDFPTASVDEAIEVITEVVPAAYIEDVLFNNAFKLGQEFNWW